MGRTPGALNKPKNNEDFDFDNTTTIEGGEFKPKQENRGKKSGGRISVEKETIADKLNILCEGIASILGLNYTFQSSDYNKEATALCNIAKLYSPVARVLELFDPLLIVFGIFSKFKEMRNKKQQSQVKNVKPQTTEHKEPEQNQTVQNQGGLSLLKMG